MGTPGMRGVGRSIWSATWQVVPPCMFHSSDITETLCTVRTPHLTSLLQAWWLHYVPPGLTFRVSIFCPHTV